MTRNLTRMTAALFTAYIVHRSEVGPLFMCKGRYLPEDVII